MKLTRRASLAAITVAIAIIKSTLSLPALAEANDSAVPQWSVEVKQVDAGDLNIEPEFKIAIYENLLEELVKSKQFSAVLRSGDRRANDVAGLLILKIAVESYTPGSETKRAVTTVSGATKLKVRSQLCTREGQVVFEHVVDGNVRFFGGNLRATHNLAHNVANALKHAGGLRVGTERRAAEGAVNSTQNYAPSLKCNSHRNFRPRQSRTPPPHARSGRTRNSFIRSAGSIRCLV